MIHLLSGSVVRVYRVALTTWRFNARKLVLLNTLFVLGLTATLQRPTNAATADLNPTSGSVQTVNGTTFQTIIFDPVAHLSGGSMSDCHQFVLHATGLSDFTVSFTSSVGPGDKYVPEFTRVYTDGTYTIYGTASGSIDVSNSSAGYWQADTSSFNLVVF